MGSEFGAIAINPTNFGSNASPFTSLPASGTPRGLVSGKVLAVSSSGSFAVFSDTVSTPNQVYVVSTASAPNSTSLNINSATAAAFSPDGLKVFILGNGGNTLYVYSGLQSLQPPISLPAPATSIVFNSTGSFALLAGGAAASNLATYDTCDNFPVSLSAGAVPGPPLFLKMVPAVDVPLNSTFGGILIPNLEPAGLDFFFGLDNTGIDIIATTSSLLPLPLPAGSFSLTTLCPQAGVNEHLVTLAQTPAPATTFAPVHINIGQGTFHPINFFLSPDATHAYIVTSDLGILVYDFSTNSTSKIPLLNNATAVAADIAADGSLIYVAGSDGLLHQINTAVAVDQNQTSFSPLPNSSNNFCFTGTNCALNIVAVKP
jgi:WD40 repeat protein